MPSAPERKGHKPSKQLAAIDRLLIAGIKQGPGKKRDAINRILELVPGWTREDCWERIRHLRKTPEFAALAEGHSTRAKSPGETRPAPKSPAMPWTPAHDDKLLNLAGYEPVKKIARRLGRSERAVRCRLGALGISGKVTDGWSLRTLQATLRVRRTRLRQLIGLGILKVRDGYGQTDHLCETRAQPVVDQHSGVLRVVLELDDVVIAVGAAHEMALRAAAHPADMLNRLYRHVGCPFRRRYATAACGESFCGIRIRSGSEVEHGDGHTKADRVRRLVDCAR